MSQVKPEAKSPEQEGIRFCNAQVPDSGKRHQRNLKVARSWQQSQKVLHAAGRKKRSASSCLHFHRFKGSRAQMASDEVKMHSTLEARLGHSLSGLTNYALWGHLVALVGTQVIGFFKKKKVYRLSSNMEVFNKHYRMAVIHSSQWLWLPMRSGTLSYKGMSLHIATEMAIF